jgi:hypothetical protein
LSFAVASGCATPTGPKATKATATSPAGAKPAATGSAPLSAGAILAGRVSAPAGVIAAGGANVVAWGGANVVAAGGGNAVAPGGANFGDRRVLAVSEKPLANTQVFLADAAGNPLPGVKPVTTDAQGQFKFAGIPAGYTFLVVAAIKTAEGKDARFETMTHPTQLGATADVSAATTLVTAALVDGRSELGEFNAAKFKSAVDATAKNLDPDALPDFADREAVLASVRELQASVAELKTALDEMRQQLQDIQDSLSDLKKQLGDRADAVQASLPPILTPPPGVVDDPAPGPGATATEAVAVVLSMPSQADAARPEAYPVVVSFASPDGMPISQVRFASPTELVPHKLPVGKPFDVTYQPFDGNQVVIKGVTFDGKATMRLPWDEESIFIPN